MNEFEYIINRICKAPKVNIYGAGLMGRALLKCLMGKPYSIQICNFIVRDLSDNQDNVDGVPVIDIQGAKKFREELLLVALHEKHMTEAVAELNKAGFKNIIQISFDSDLWAYIRKNWMIMNHCSSEVVSCNINKIFSKKLSIYVVHSDADKKLMEDLADQDYEVPIKVGVAISDKLKMNFIRDDTGDNISLKNRQYCELTALYWIWKNDKSDYAGLCHYRRKFNLDHKVANILPYSDIDFVVTIPIVNFNTVRGQYEIDHDIKDWEIMLEAIKELYPEYFTAANTVQNGIFYYAYNMFIAKKKVLDTYCEWLFSILDYCEKKIGKKEDVYQNRYAGFLAERLLTIYITKHSELKIAMADKHFIETQII